MISIPLFFSNKLYQFLFGGFKNNVYVIIYELKKELINIRQEIEVNKNEEDLVKLKERENQIILALNEFYN